MSISVRIYTDLNVDRDKFLKSLSKKDIAIFPPNRTQGRMIERNGLHVHAGEEFCWMASIDNEKTFEWLQKHPQITFVGKSPVVRAN